MIYQLTEGLDPRLKISGCYFMSILKIYEKIAGVVLSLDQINNIFKLCVRFEYVDEEAYIKERAVSGIAQVASAVGGVPVFMKLVSQPSTGLIAKFTRSTSFGKIVTHFNLMADKNTIEYDPYSQEGARTSTLGKIDSYRHIYAEKF